MFRGVKKILIFFVLLAGFFATAHFALAAVDVGTGFIAKTGLAAVDPRLIIARIIQIFLGFLAIIALALIMYGGYLWMTSVGDEAQVQKAKDVLRNAIIGLVIILSAFGIVTFLLTKIMGATGISQIGGSGGAKGIGGSGVLGSCSVESVYPASDQREVPRNTAIIITFKEAVNSATVCATVDASGHCNGANIITVGPSKDWPVKIYKSGDEASSLSNVKVYDKDNKTFVFVPGEYLGSPSEYLWYTVHLSSEISKPDNRSIFESCQNDFMQWAFEVSNKIDLAPPQVKNKGVFPPPDNGKDTVSVSSVPAQAAGSITFRSQPSVYSEATSSGAVVGPNVDKVVIDSNCSEGGALQITVKTDGLTAQLSNSGRQLGSAVFSGRTITFNGFLSLSLIADPVAGNSWNIPVTAVKEAATLTIGQMVYVFVKNPSTPNHIRPGSTLNWTASNTAAVVDAHPDVGAVAVNNRVDIKATLAGVRGNSIAIGTTTITTLLGGADRDQQISVSGRKDQPMNTVIQINFNEAVLPTTITGASDQVANYIRVVNASGGANNGTACSADSDCQSYKCDKGACLGDVLAGTFKISNQYRTVEFVSNNQCGVNGCGDPIYCLPPNSQLRVEMTAAGLTPCTAQDDCVAKTPYNTCSTRPLSGALQLCRQDFKGNNIGSRSRSYPVADNSFNGVMDAAFNSLDGDRNTFADGPITTFSDNPKAYSGNPTCQADFDRIISAVKDKRIELNKTLGDITGPFWASGACVTPADCEAKMRSIMQALGVQGSIKDFGGALFYFNEKEDKAGAPSGACIHDEVYSANCNSGTPVPIPFYFCAEGDNYSWTFFISDKMDTSAPALEAINPARNAGIAIADEISGQFSKLMMSSSLGTGETKINNGQKIIAHKNLNLWSLADKAVGYWGENEGVDVNSDGEMEKTKVYIRHGLLDSAVSYRAQMGSGVKDIYQNCYKPSAGPDCSGGGAVTADKPSCCNGTAATDLGQNGSCR